MSTSRPMPVSSVEYDFRGTSFAGVQVESLEGQSSRYLPCRTILLAAGPWSHCIYRRLFPDASVKLRMDSTNRAGNHVRIKIPGWNDGDKEESVQVYYTNVTLDGSRFDVTSFTNGALYIGGWGAIPEEVPELASSVHAQPSEVKGMLEFVKKYVNVPTDRDVEYFDAGRCYRPTALANRPIITRIDTGSLIGKDPSVAGNEENDTKDYWSAGGLVICTAHGSDGITVGPGSGQVASELVLGKTPSVDISSLGIPESYGLVHLTRRAVRRPDSSSKVKEWYAGFS
jgi:glycine/D-amino acid oxidase-like deaminating enzyme